MRRDREGEGAAPSAAGRGGGGGPARGIVFDLDGTLVDTLEDIAAALDHALGELGCPGHDLAAYRLMVGEGSRALVERALPPERREALADECLLAFGRRYGENLVVRSRLYPGVASLLDEVARRGVPASVLSNKPDALTREVIRRLLGPWPWAWVAGQREGVARKPDPAAALEAALAMGAPPEGCLFLGDSAIDMRTARAAGMVPVGASWGFRSRAELVEHGAARVIDQPAELLSLL